MFRVLKLMCFLMVFATSFIYAKSFDFDKTKVGTIPQGWISAITNLDQFPTWRVIKDSTAPSSNQVLSLINTDARGSEFNLCYTKKVNFLDGKISVMFKAKSGQEDEGGGIMWRVKDSGNYYVARFNPLEDNLCFYYVKNSYRRLLNSANIALDKNSWHSMKIIQNKSHYKIFLDGKKLLEGDDSTFNKSGGVGVWTKSDALTSFDNLKINH